MGSETQKLAAAAPIGTGRIAIAPDVPIRMPNIRDVAQEIALEKNNRVLVLIGSLDGPKGLPKIIGHHADAIELRLLRNYTDHLNTGVFEIRDEDALSPAIDRLQEQGGYRATVLNVDGSIDPAYTI